MPSIEQCKGDKIHTRKIDVSTYECDENHLIVEGRLTDNRLKSSYTISGKKRPPSVIHDMIIRLKVEMSTMVIVDVEVELPTVPEEECPGGARSMETIKGMTISGGFTPRIKKILKGTKGCSHLTTLLLSMAPAAVQASFANTAREPFPDIPVEMAKQLFGDSCYVWRMDGPLTEEIEEMFGSGEDK